MTNRPGLVNRIQVMPGLSDHYIVYTEPDVRPSSRKQIPRYVPIYNRANWAGFRARATKLAARIIDAESSSTVDHLWTTFKE